MLAVVREALSWSKWWKNISRCAVGEVTVEWRKRLFGRKVSGAEWRWLVFKAMNFDFICLSCEERDILIRVIRFSGYVTHGQLEKSWESMIWDLVVGDRHLAWCGEKKKQATVKVKSGKSLNRQGGEVWCYRQLGELALGWGSHLDRQWVMGDCWASDFPSE